MAHDRQPTITQIASRPLTGWRIPNRESEALELRTRNRTDCRFGAVAWWSDASYTRTYLRDRACDRRPFRGTFQSQASLVASIRNRVA
jgi:hypothetical protein